MPWKTHVDNLGTVEETEVHQLEMSAVILEASRQKGEALWVLEVVGKDSSAAMGERQTDENLASGMLRLLTRGAEMLVQDSGVLTRAMLEIHNRETARRDGAAALQKK